MGKVIFTPEELAQSAVKYRKELLMMPVFKLGETLQHMTPRYGIRYKEKVGELSGDMQLGPYSETRIDDTDVNIKGRTLGTYLGSVVKKFSPNSVYQSIYSDAVTKGESLKKTEITRRVLAFLAGKLGENIHDVMWNAVRNGEGDKTIDLFDGFDTIALGEIKKEEVSKTKGNLYNFSEAITGVNAVDILKDFYRSANPKLRKEQTKLFISHEIYDKYVDDYQASKGPLVYNQSFDKVYLEGSRNRCELVPLFNKEDSNLIQLTTKRNLLVGFNQRGEEESIVVEKHEAFVLQFIATLFIGAQYESISPERLLIGKLFTETE